MTTTISPAEPGWKLEISRSALGSEHEHETTVWKVQPIIAWVVRPETLDVEAPRELIVIGPWGPEAMAIHTHRAKHFRIYQEVSA